MKNLFLAFFALVGSLFLAGAATAQQVTYGNEWINFSQKYYKIKVPATGIYKLDYAYLQAAGISGVDPRKFQLFRRGKEVSIYVAGENDGSFDNGDFIEFYGEKNDGSLDKELYKDASLQVNPNYSLYTDTAAYFLTWSTGNGKRMEGKNTSSTGLTAEPWFWQTRLYQNTDQYSRGRNYGQNNMSWLDGAEGFMSSSSSSTRNVVVDSLLNTYTQGPKPTVEVAIAGSNASTPDVDVYAVNGTSVRLLGNVTFDIYGSTKASFPLEFTDITADGKVTIRFTSKNGSASRVSYIKVRFPQRPVMQLKVLGFEPAVSTNTSLLYSLEGASAADAIVYDITSLESISRIAGVMNGAKKDFEFLASTSSANRKGLVWSKPALIPLPATNVNLRSFQTNKATYLILSHKSLMTATGSSTNPIRDYAIYRASAVGGGHDTLTVDVDQLYDQFFYGDKSAVAIRRFMKFMLANGSPKYLFIIGKGIETDNVNVRKNPAALASKDLIPTGGIPSSDVFFTSNWEQDDYAPKVATGRIPAQTAADVLAYLEKIKEHEALPQNAEWRKNILHLGGGINKEEGAQFESYLNNYKRIAEGPFLGGLVKTKARESTQDLETINVSAEVNAGLSLITFFGHSSSTYSDLDIGYVSVPQNGYNNKGKYPMILMNGCGAGNSSTANVSFGEDWLLTPQKGIILFMAHTSTGYPSLLNIFSRTFYDVAFANEETYGKPMGVIHQEMVKQLSSTLSGANAIAMLMQMDLKGDPGVVLVAPEKPDYTINNSSLGIKSLDGKPLSAATEKFAVTVDVKNLGKAIDKPFYITAKRVLANGEVLQIDSVQVPNVYNRGTFEVAFESKVPVPGINHFEVSLDLRNEVDELDETNNTARLEFFFPASSVLALAPYQYSIVSTQKVKLVGQSTNILNTAPEFYFEIDTVATFKSSWLKSSVVKGGTLPVWEVTLPDNTSQKDSMVYFWRFRNKEVAAQEDTIWATSSFRYIPASPAGWSQSRFAQLSDVTAKDLDIVAVTKKMEFRENVDKAIRIRAAGGNITVSYPPHSIFIEGSRNIHSDCNTNRPNMLAVVFDDKTLEVYKNMPTTTASICGLPLEDKFSYHFVDLRVAANLVKLENFLKSVPQGYYVVMMGMSNVPYSTMSESLKNEFKSIGSSLITNLKTGDPFGIIGRKGAAPGSVPEVGPSADDPAAAADQTILLEGQIKTNSGKGTLMSTLIGPATKWSTLHHQMALEPSDSYQLEVLGVDKDEKEKVLFANVTSTNFDLSTIDAATYPYLKLRLTLKDEEQRTAPQLKQWTVLYEGVPEGVLRPDLVGLDKYQKLSEQAATGQVDIQFAFHNISDRDFSGPLTVETILFEENGNRTAKDYKLEKLLNGDTVYFQHKFSTLNMKGANRLRVTVNPRNHPDVLLEQNYFNNTLELPFTVGLTAGMPPVLDVVFDGVRILDGDIVSPSPVISMQLKDNNRLIPITDPTSLKVYLKKPGAEFVEIDVATDPNVRWYPADDKNDFRVEYNPEALADGKYTLEVQGFDALGQRAGNERYSINFEVINESSISNFYPYPNPFSSKTKFVFTLTGSKVPDKMKLQIMTVTGKVIKEVQKEELGPIRIGNNVSEFAWDGTDEYGDRLANGVYLYRVVMDNGPEEMKHRTTSSDKAFKKGYGKIYILR